MATNEHKAKVWLENRGWVADRCGGRRGKFSFDWKGFGDVLAVHPEQKQVLMLQVTSHDNVTARVKKILGECTQDAIGVLRSGVRVEVWGFTGQSLTRGVELGLEGEQQDCVAVSREW